MKTVIEAKEILKSIENAEIVLPSASWENKRTGKIRALTWIIKKNPTEETVRKLLTVLENKLKNNDFSHDLGEKWKNEGYLEIFTWYLDIKVLDTIESFISGFGRFGSDFEPEINNAVFIAIKKLNLNVPLEFRDGGRLGIESLELYSLFDHIATGGKKDEKAFKAGQELSKLNAEELRLIASYFWNGGKSSLFKEEREKARELIEKHFLEVKQ